MTNETCLSSNKSFNEYYDNIPDGKKKEILLEYMKESEQSIGTFYNKKKKEAFTRLEKGLLERICGQSFNWFPQTLTTNKIP